MTNQGEKIIHDLLVEAHATYPRPGPDTLLRWIIDSLEEKHWELSYVGPGQP